MAPIGLCVGWLIAMVVEAVLSVPWLRDAFGGLHWQSPLSLRRAEAGRVAPHVVGAVALVALIVGVGVWTSTRAGQETPARVLRRRPRGSRAPAPRTPRTASRPVRRR